MFGERGLIMDNTEISANSQSATSFMGFVDSPDFDFVSPVKPMSFTHLLSFRSLESPANCQFHGSPQPRSYPSTVDENKAIVNNDPTPPNNHDLMPSEPCLQEWSYGNGKGNLGGEWDDVMSFCTSIMQNRVPCGDMFSGGFMEMNPKKRQRRLEEGGGSCKRCKCKKSKCLMLYCECFATGVYCVGPCECLNCFNNHIHKDKVLAARKEIEWRKPLAFVMRMWDDDFRRSGRRKKRGWCSCKKGCHMKYCGCYEGGVGCSSNCRCEGCKNKFGTNSGSSIDLELEQGSQHKTCNLNNKALEASGDINAVNSPSAVAVAAAAASNGQPPISATTTTSVLAAAELGQSVGGLVSNVGPTTTYGFGLTPDNNLQDLDNASAFPMASSTQSDFGFASQPDPFMFCGHQTDAAAAAPSFHPCGQILL